jgi:hypothetical protein
MIHRVVQGYVQFVMVYTIVVFAISSSLAAHLAWAAYEETSAVCKRSPNFTNFNVQMMSAMQSQHPSQHSTKKCISYLERQEAHEGLTEAQEAAKHAKAAVLIRLWLIDNVSAYSHNGDKTEKS